MWKPLLLVFAICAAAIVPFNEASAKCLKKPCVSPPPPPPPVKGGTFIPADQYKEQLEAYRVSIKALYAKDALSDQDYKTGIQRYQRGIKQYNRMTASQALNKR
jgi:hypothetical protein